MNAREAHDRAVQKLADEYAGNGFKVHKDAKLPFIQYQADLLAERGDEHHVIEVKLQGVRNEQEGRQWETLAKEVRQHPGWHFKLVLVEHEAPPLPNAAVIEAELTNAEVLLAQDKLAAAMLLAASAFEASARRRLGAIDALPKTPGGTALVERLVSEGEVDQEAFVPLRDALELRHAIVHGHLDQLPGRDVVERLVEGARRLLTAA